MAKRILLVDDEPLIVKGLKYTLEQEGFETDSAADGEEALTKFFSGHFDFILLDVMPAQNRRHHGVPAHPRAQQTCPSSC